ncbi:MAG TPA: hypothetical protein VJV78_01065 [Polyangiales bacterium]|nr:hypothetical protein [Polyangiales bacterium]
MAAAACSMSGSNVRFHRMPTCFTRSPAGLFLLVGLLLSAACDGGGDKRNPSMAGGRSHGDRDAAVSVDGEAGDAAPAADAGPDEPSNTSDASPRDPDPPPAADAAARKDAEPPAQHEDAAAPDNHVTEPEAEPNHDPAVPSSQAQPCAALNASGNVLLELGHGSGVGWLRQSASRIASRDSTGHWLLWNSQTHEKIASGGIACPAETPQCRWDRLGMELDGDILAVAQPESIELRSASSGQLLTTITTDFALGGDSGTPRLGLSVEGGYVWTATERALSAWTLSGELLFRRAGYYGPAEIFAAPNGFRIANSPMGADRVELVALNGTTSATPAFSGRFYAWFSDGERFITHVDSVARIYSKAAEQLQVVAMPATPASAGGTGDYFWIASNNGGPVSMYRLGQSTPFLTEQPEGYFRLYSARSLVLMVNGSVMTLIDLAGTTPHTRELPSPGVSAFGAADAEHWSVANGSVLLDGAQPDSAGNLHPMNCGAVNSVAGAANGRISVALAVGQILHIALATRTLERVIPMSSSRVALSQDGSVLVAQRIPPYSPVFLDHELVAYDMPAGTERSTLRWPGNGSAAQWELARGGQRIARVPYPGEHPETQHIIVGDLQGQDAYDVDTGNSDTRMSLSPDGTRLAFIVRGQSTTRIFHDGVLEGAAEGIPIGWLDETQLLLQKYQRQGSTAQVYLSSVIVNPLGNVTATPALPAVEPWLPLPYWADAPVGASAIVDSSALYIARTNAVYDVHTGDASWQGPMPAPNEWPPGAVADDFVAFARGSALYVEPR